MFMVLLLLIALAQIRIGSNHFCYCSVATYYLGTH